MVHEAQDVFDSLLDAGARPFDESANQVRLQADAMVREDLLRRQFDLSRNQTSYLNGQLNWLSSQKLEVERLLQESREELGRKEETLQATRLDLGRTEELLHANRGLLHRSEREVSESHAELVQALARVAELRARLDRFEGHRVIASGLRARRLLRRALQSLRTRPSRGISIVPESIGVSPTRPLGSPEVRQDLRESHALWTPDLRWFRSGHAVCP